MRKVCCILLVFFISLSFLFADDFAISMEFRNQKITDIVYALAEMEGKSVICDETVSGNTSFVFRDNDFDSAIYRFAESTRLFIERKADDYILSKVRIEENEAGLFDVDAEDVNTEIFLKLLSRKSNVTIMSDQIGNINITIRVKDKSISEILDIVLLRLAGFEKDERASGFYLYKTVGQNARRQSDMMKISKNGDLYSVDIQRAQSVSVIDALFKKAEREYSLLYKPSATLENIRYKNKDFNQLLSLILQQSGCDWIIKDNVYCIYEAQKKDIIKQFRTTREVKLANTTADKVISLLPSDFSSSNMIKTDKATNTIYLLGSESEIAPVEEFIRNLDSKTQKGEFKRFDLVSITALEAQSLIPKDMLISDIITLPSGNSFITEVNDNNSSLLSSFIDTIDKKTKSYTIKLKYIKSELLLKNLPPSVDKSLLFPTKDLQTVFFTGTLEQYNRFCEELKEIDVPEKQIRYQILVIQRQKTDSLMWNSKPSIKSDNTKSGNLTYSASLSNILNINFDIISKFGMQFAETLNSEIDEGFSLVLADTTLNALSGESVKFSNTGTYRYRDVVIEGTTSRYTTTTREITSGLSLDINGWVSGDDVITVSIDASVSKQGASQQSGSDTTNPPSTTEKKVSTTVRAKSGEPVIIGGLIESDMTSSEGRTPGLGVVPVVGNLFKGVNKSRADTEFVIYLVPFAEKYTQGVRNKDENIRRYYEKYITNTE